MRRRTLRDALGHRVLWKKTNIVLEMPLLATQGLVPPSCPSGAPSYDDNDKGGDDRDRDVGGGPSHRAPPAGSSHPDTSNPQEETPPPSTLKDQGQCPPVPNKPTTEEECAPLPDTNSPQGWSPPPSTPKDKGQCPLAPKKHTTQEKGRPPGTTDEAWVAFNLAEVYKHLTRTLERYART